jgi:glutathionylspermidine synthase
MYDAVSDNECPFEFVHMKIPLQNWTSIYSRWSDAVPFVLTYKGDLVVGNIKQPKLFHYVEKNFLNTDLIKQLEGLVNGS